MTTDYQRNSFKVDLRAGGHGSAIEMNGKPLRGVRKIAFSGEYGEPTTVKLTLIGCDVSFEADGFVYVEVKDIASTHKSFVRFTDDEYIDLYEAEADLDAIVRERAVIDVEGAEAAEVEDAEVVEEAVAVENAVPTRPGRVRNA